ncbi:hypothetical protein, partial [Acinetobacter chengduensis]
GDIGKAEAMENYVLSKAKISPNAGAEPKPYTSTASLGGESKVAQGVNEGSNTEEECGCFFCFLYALINTANQRSK